MVSVADEISAMTTVATIAITFLAAFIGSGLSAAHHAGLFGWYGGRLHPLHLWGALPAALTVAIGGSFLGTGIAVVPTMLAIVAAVALMWIVVRPARPEGGRR